MASLIVRSFVLVAGLTLCLLLSAGDWQWAAGWTVAGLYALFVALALLLVDTELLQERARPTPGYDHFDALLATAGFLLLYPGLMVTAGLDAVRFQWSSGLPVALRIGGVSAYILGYGFALWAMLANRFFTTFVRIQRDRGHLLVTSGPYRVVRHPGYAGMLLAHFGLPLALGSLWAYVPVALGAAIFVTRTVREERTLSEAMPEYTEYQRQVPWRLAPGIY